MTTLPQGTRRKLSLLKLAEELGTSPAPAGAGGYHRDMFKCGNDPTPGPPLIS
jgi:hypothetical protein